MSEKQSKNKNGGQKYPAILLQSAEKNVLEWVINHNKSIKIGFK